MRPARAWVLRLLGIFRRRKADSDFADELESHLLLDIDEGIAAGLTPEEARRRARLRLGGVEQVKKAYRDRRGVPVLECLAGDVFYAARILRAHPGFTAVVVVTLGLGIGAATAIFTVVNGVLLRPLPYPKPERLVSISETLGERPNPFTYTRDYAAFRDHNRTLSGIGAYMYFAANFHRGGGSERVVGGLATRSLFNLLGVRPVLGRNFLPEEDAPGGPAVAMLSHGFWRRRLASDPGVIGKSVTLDGRAYTIVGVLPAGFRMPGEHEPGPVFQLWLPFAIQDGRAALNEIMLFAVGRLRIGATVAQAAADLEPLQQLRLRGGMSKHVRVTSWQSQVTRGIGGALLIFSCAVILVLLVACVNVANLLLSRAATREREIALRRAMGAGRGRIVRQLLTESTLIAMLGGLLGLALAHGGTRVLIAFLAPNLPSLDPIHIDGRVLLFNAAVALLTGFAFGLAPAIDLSRPELALSLNASRRGLSEGTSKQRLRGVLVITEVGLAMVLLSGAGLLVRSFLRLRGVDAGYRPDHILTVTVDLTESQYRSASTQAAFVTQALDRLREIPGVLSVGATNSPPFPMYSVTVTEVSLEGRPAVEANVSAVTVSPDYFRTLGIPLLRGRYLSARDDAGSPSAVLVSESFARRFCADRDCLGRRLANWAKDKDWMTIAGVVRDIRRLPEEEPAPTMYASFLQAGGTHVTFVIRSAADPKSISSAVRSAIATVDRTQPPHDAMTMRQALDTHLTARRVKMQLVAVFAGLALLLGASGMYGVLAYSVKRRTHEIGVRMALGADRGHVLGMVMKSGMSLAGAGIIAGWLVSLGLTRLISRELWGVSASDCWTSVIVGSVLLLSGAAACLVPALRAARVDPIRSLRHE